MKSYELTYIITSSVSSEEAQSCAKEIESAIQAQGGVIVKQEIPSAKPLAYPIKGQGSGFVATIEFQSEPENVKELENKLSKDSKIIRSMLTIKQHERPRKERGRRQEAQPQAQAEAPKEEPKPENKEVKEDDKKEKVELKDIEQKLDEILGE